MSTERRPINRSRPALDDPHGSPFVAQIYDEEHAGDEADIGWAAQMAAGGAVADLGCGTGRLTIPLARAGCQVLAIDRSAPMLAQLRRKLAGEPAAVRHRVTVLETDLARWSLPAEQPPRALVLLGYNTFGALLSAAVQEQCLSNARASLAAGGRLALATAAVHARLVLLPDGLEQQVYRRAVPSLGPGVALARRDIHRWTDETLQLRQLAVVYDVVEADGGRRREQFEYAVRYTSRWELEHLLYRTGFHAVQVFGGYAGEPFLAEGGLLVVSARA